MFSKQLLRCSLWLLCCAILSACVTTRSGGLPEPASLDKRVEAQLALARAFLSERDFERARAPLDRAMQLDANSVEAQVLYAVLSNGEGEPEIAEKYFKKAIRLDSADAQALSNYGSFLISKRRAAEAVPLLKRAVADTGYGLRSQAYENLGIAELRVGNKTAAQLAFARAVNLNREQARSNLELAAMAQANGDHVDALELYKNFRGVGKQSARSTCLGMQIAASMNDQDSVASHALALKNLYPNSRLAKNCKVP